MYKVEGAALSVFFICIRVVFCQIDLIPILRFGMPSKIQKYKERCYFLGGTGKEGERKFFSFFSFFLERV